MCEEAHSAGIIQKRASELRKLDLEHPCHYSKKNLMKVCGDVQEID